MDQLPYKQVPISWFDVMMKIVDTKSSIGVLVSDKKQEGHKYVKPEYSVLYKFVRYGNKWFIPTISIDIDDKHLDNEKIIELCLKHNIPAPFFTVGTDRGIHIHWVFENPIKTANVKQVELYRKVVTVLVSLFGGDIHAVPKNAGRVWRNPITHTTREMINPKFCSLSDFSHIISFDEGNNIAGSNEPAKRGRVKIDMSKVKPGQRNISLFDAVRWFAYDHYKEPNLYDITMSYAEKLNSQMPEPLPNDEVYYTVNSIVKWTQTNYKKDKTKDQRTIEFNRTMAKKKQEKAINAILQRIFTNPLLLLSQVKKMSARQGAKIFGVSHSTFKKYQKQLIELIKQALEGKKVVIPDAGFLMFFKPYIVELTKMVRETLLNGKSPPVYTDST